MKRTERVIWNARSRSLTPTASVSLSVSRASPLLDVVFSLTWLLEVPVSSLSLVSCRAELYKNSDGNEATKRRLAAGRQRRAISLHILETLCSARSRRSWTSDEQVYCASSPWLDLLAESNDTREHSHFVVWKSIIDFVSKLLPLKETNLSIWFGLFS